MHYRDGLLPLKIWAFFVPGSWFLPNPDPESKNSNKREGWKQICCHTFICSHKFHKIVNYFIFEMLKKKFGPIFKELLNFLPKILSLSSQKYGFGIRNLRSRVRKKPIPDPGSRGQKGTGSRIPDHNTVFIWYVWQDDGLPHGALDGVPELRVRLRILPPCQHGNHGHGGLRALGEETGGSKNHRLNMELDLQSLLGFMSRDVYSCTHWLRPGWDHPRPPAFGLVYTRALLVSQDRRHLFVTPWSEP